MNTPDNQREFLGSPRVERWPWFLALARRYVRRRLAKNFNGVFIRGLSEVQKLVRERAVIIAANHVAWWDAFLVVLIDEALGTEGYCLMDKANLERLPFFRWLGAVELDRSHPANSSRDLLRSLQLLSIPLRALWVFPQGRQRPPHLRPLALQSGVALLAQRSGLPVVPLSISYAYLDAPQPRIALNFSAALERFGPAQPPLRWRSWQKRLESQLIEGLDNNDRFILEGDDRYLPLLNSSVPSSDAPAAARWLSALSPFFRSSNVRSLPVVSQKPGPKL